jgi:peptide/nickel transport system substrate-binding protein
MSDTHPRATLRRRSLARAAGGSLAAALLPAIPARAQAGPDPLRIAFADPISSLDPQLNNNAGDRSVALFFFDLLINNNDNALQPGLATRWTATGPLTWEFELRPGVKWHDGRDFTADDVVFSYARAPNVPGSVASFAGYLRTVATVEATGPLSLRITTKEPNPLLPLNLASVHIVSRHATEGATTDDFNTGRALIGTGPFRYVSYTPGARTVMRRNDEYWGGKSAWANVDYRYVGNPAARTAALLAGDVDVIDKVSVADVAKLKENGAVRVFAYDGLRVLVMQPGFTPPGPNRYVTGADGKPLEKNPIHDVRVRRALTMAINRQGLVDRLMQGTATVASQWMPKGTFGYDPSIPATPYDPEGARKLLAEAGYPQGFNLVIHVPADRYVAGSETAQAVAQAWSRIGVRTSVETLTWTLYQSRVNKGEFAMTMIAWGNGTGESSYGLLNILATQDASRGQGVSNWGHYSNAEVDALMDKASAAFDEREREALLQKAARIVDAEVGIMPLFHYQNIWAARRGLLVKPLNSDRTVAAMVSRD